MKLATQYSYSVRWQKWALMLILILAGYFGVGLHIDWWLYHLYSNRVTGNVAVVSQRLKMTGLPTQTLGNIAYGNEQWLIEAAVLSKPTATQTVCVFAGIHDNEPAGTEAALTLAEDLARSPKSYPHLNFTIVPLANPWGWAHQLRHNGTNHDIARDFVADNEQETKLIKQFLRAHHCDLLVDLHEDRIRSGFYMLTYENAKEKLLAHITQAVKQHGYKLNSQTPNGIYHIRQTEFSSLSRPTLALYARQNGVLQSYILETPMRLDMTQRVALHRLVLTTLLDGLER